MHISAEKTQLMKNNTNGIGTDITMDNKKLLGISYRDRIANEEVKTRIGNVIGP